MEECKIHGFANIYCSETCGREDEIRYGAAMERIMFDMRAGLSEDKVTQAVYLLLATVHARLACRKGLENVLKPLEQCIDALIVK